MKVFYAIDMGAPSKSGGFFCWKCDLENNLLIPFIGAKDWDKCVASIAQDALNSKICLTIEAVLWGMKDKEGNWIKRFYLKDDPDLTEHPWYKGAGASTGLMAQEFLKQLEEKIGKNETVKITLYESYISGLALKGTRTGVPKPDKKNEILVNSKKSAHGHDALEGLLRTLEEEQINHTEFKKFFDSQKISLEAWPLSIEERIIYSKDCHEAFPLGILRNSHCPFELRKGKILFTKRTFDMSELKKAS
jgi:hypothetical protein